MRRALTLLAAAALSAAAVSARAQPGARPTKPVTPPSCTVFPSNNPWNRRVDTLPVASNSTTIISSIGATEHLHPDFGSGLWNGGLIGIPTTEVGPSTPRSTVTFDYADESDAGPYPIPSNVRIEAGSDRHAILVDRSACMLYELFALEQTAGGWRAGSGAIWSMTSNALRPEGWTSADAAGLPILPGLARYDEVAAGRITHALRFTVLQSRRAYVWPARHYASSLTNPSLPPMGLRLRLKSSFDISGFPTQARVVLRALKEYGMMVADNGSDWYITGEPDERWSNDDLRTLRQVPGSAFEVVDTSSLVLLERNRGPRP